MQENINFLIIICFELADKILMSMIETEQQRIVAAECQVPVELDGK